MAKPIVSLILMSIGLVPLTVCREDSRHPSDAVLEERFRRHEADFDKLIGMFQEDADLVRIARDFTWLKDNAAWPRSESEVGVSRQRWDEYRGLFQKLGLDHGLTRRQDIGGVVFLNVSATGLVTGGNSKGYAYSTTELSPLVASLDHITIQVKHLEPVYKRIKGDWYLYYECDD